VTLTVDLKTIWRFVAEIYARQNSTA